MILINLEPFRIISKVSDIIKGLIARITVGRIRISKTLR